MPSTTGRESLEDTLLPVVRHIPLHYEGISTNQQGSRRYPADRLAKLGGQGSEHLVAMLSERVEFTVSVQDC